MIEDAPATIICEHMWTFLFTSLESKTAALPLAIAPFMASPASKYTRLRVRAWRSWTCLSCWHSRSMDPTANGFWDKERQNWQMVHHTHHTSTIKHSPYHNCNSILKFCSIVLIVSRLQRVFWCKIISNRNLLDPTPWFHQHCCPITAQRQDLLVLINLSQHLRPRSAGSGSVSGPIWTCFKIFEARKKWMQNDT